MELHHFAFKIRPGTLEKVIELFEKMGLVLSYREGDARWALVEFIEKKIEIQLIESTEKSCALKQKLETHIAFISKEPQQELAKVEKWANSEDIVFKPGKWNEEMLWFDLPDVFINFVVEIMDYSVIEK